MFNNTNLVNLYEDEIKKKRKIEYQTG